MSFLKVNRHRCKGGCAGSRWMPSASRAPGYGQCMLCHPKHSIAKSGRTGHPIVAQFCAGCAVRSKSASAFPVKAYRWCLSWQLGMFGLGLPTVMRICGTASEGNDDKRRTHVVSRGERYRLQWRCNAGRAKSTRRARWLAGNRPACRIIAKWSLPGAWQRNANETQMRITTAINRLYLVC